MTSKPHIVIGEAGESESEEEINSSVIVATSNDEAEHCRGKIVVGEAPESDEELFSNSGSMESVSSAVSALSAATVKKKKKSSKKHQSVLVKKLYERNGSLYRNLREFIESSSTNAGNELNAANKRLLKCQMQMQEGADHLKILNSNLTGLDVSLQMLLSAKYLPQIQINDNVHQEN